MSNIAVVDIETTGFLNQGGLIVEIGIVGLNIESGEITCEFDSLVREPDFGPEHAKYPFGWIFNNSDLQYDDVENAPSLDSKRNEIQIILDKFPLGATAYNKNFDFGFLKSRGFRIKELPCPMLVATPVVNLPSVNGYDTPKWPKVEEAWDFFFGDTGYIESHRAADDAIHEAKIVFELYKLGKFEINNLHLM